MTSIPKTGLAAPTRTTETLRPFLLFAGMAALIALTGMAMGWNYALTVINMGLISAIMALGVNLQWGFAGLFNVGIMGFVALGGLAAVLVAMPPVAAAWTGGGLRVLGGLALGVLTVVALFAMRRRIPAGRMKGVFLIAAGILGVLLTRAVFDPGVAVVEAVNPASSGYLGGLGLPILLAWPAGGLLAAGAAWIIGKTALGLRSDYLAIATLGIAEIILAILKNEDWLARGVKNVVAFPRPCRRPSSSSPIRPSSNVRPGSASIPCLPRRCGTRCFTWASSQRSCLCCSCWRNWRSSRRGVAWFAPSATTRSQPQRWART